MKQVQLVCILLATVLLSGCKGRQVKVNGKQEAASKLRIQILDKEALSIIDSTQKITVIASGFTWTEGPLYISDGDYLLFSDIPPNKVFKWKEGQGVTTYLSPSGNTGPARKVREPGSNGLLLREGNLVLCQHSDRRIARMAAPLDAPRPQFVVLADNYKGKRLNSPNDAVYHPNGDLYFTDPAYGLDKGIYDSAKELDFQGVFRLKPDGRLDVVTKGLKYPNGIALSPDNKFLYVASSDSNNYVWMQYELDANGLAKSQRLFNEAHAYEGRHLGAPDGMKISKKGYLFASGPEGLWLFNPGGKLIARLYTGRLTSNCALSPDEGVLYITCDNSVMQLRLKK